MSKRIYQRNKISVDFASVWDATGGSKVRGNLTRGFLSIVAFNAGDLPSKDYAKRRSKKVVKKCRPSLYQSDCGWDLLRQAFLGKFMEAN